MRVRLGFAASVLIIHLASGGLWAQHPGDIFVGRSQTGQLKRSGFDVVENYVSLMPVSGLLNGWTDNDPGFDRVVMSDADADLFTLAPGALIWLSVIEINPAFRVIDPSFAILDDPGEQTFLGNQNLHVHVTWHINSADPEFDAAQCVWEATFILRDMGTTNYQDGAPFTMKFTNVPQIKASGDFDEDGDVDLLDYAAMPDCFAGPEHRPQPDEFTHCEVDCLNTFDFEGDNDVDLRDFAEFEIIFGD